jgi:Tfp pilus assembly protein PilO
MANTLGSYRRYSRYYSNFKQFYQKKQVRVYTELILSLLTIIFFLVFAIRPTLITIASLINEIDEKKILVQKLDNKINTLNLAQAEYERVKDKLFLIDEALPQNSEFSLLIRQVEALARRNGLAINSIQFETTQLKGEKTIMTNVRVQEKNEKGPPGASLTIELLGEYEQLKFFIFDVVGFRRLTIPEEYSFEIDEEGGALTLSLDIKAFYQSKDDLIKPALAEEEASL